MSTNVWLDISITICIVYLCTLIGFFIYTIFIKYKAYKYKKHDWGPWSKPYIIETMDHDYTSGIELGIIKIKKHHRYCKLCKAYQEEEIL